MSLAITKIDFIDTDYFHDCLPESNVTKVSDGYPTKKGYVFPYFDKRNYDTNEEIEKRGLGWDGML